MLASLFYLKWVKPLLITAGAEERLNNLAKAYAEENKVSFANGYDAILRTEEGRKLYQEYEKRK
jgi:hypothetical protein